MATRKKPAAVAEHATVLAGGDVSAPVAARVGRLKERSRGEVRGMLDGRVSRDEPWVEFESALAELAFLAVRTGR